MKRWMWIIMMAGFFAAGLGFGFSGARALWSIAYMAGGLHAHAEMVLSTQYFKDSVEARKPFNLGDYTFVPSRSQENTLKVARRAPAPEGGRER